MSTYTPKLKPTKNNQTLITPWKTYQYTEILAAMCNIIDQLQKQHPYPTK